MNIEANKKLWAKIVAKAWCDEAYKAELLNNPEQVLKAEGADIPEGVRVHVVEEQKPSTAEDIYLYLPSVKGTIVMDENEVKKAAKSCCVPGSGHCLRSLWGRARPRLSDGRSYPGGKAPLPFFRGG